MAGIYPESMSMLMLRAPAKLNLTLEVLGERRDGYHEVCSIIQTINLYDSLRFWLGQGVQFWSDMPDWTPEKSLVSKAASLLREVTGCTKGATIAVRKHIPLESGLGGDSSDAAAVLRGLNELWGLGLSREELLKLADRLSSDTSFFLFGGTALAEGRGELVTPLSPLPRLWIVLMVPPLSRMAGKTKQLYSSLKTGHYTRGQITEKLVKALTAGRGVTSSGLFNVFDEVALENFAGLGEYRERFLKAGTRRVCLAGSGPALFTLARNRNRAEKIYLNLWREGLESYLVETLPAVEPVL